jgi:phenylpropionate dioxygenase-like ring-hydroxylating dioxygenase large terminal subunit
VRLVLDEDINWKVAVDAFNEGYHVQGTHPQLLPWTDDVSLEYESLGLHAHYGRLPNARRQLQPSTRLGLSEGEYDEGEILENFVRGLGGRC